MDAAGPRRITRSVKTETSSGSDSSNTSEEERLRRLFDSCDADGDGYLDGNDFMFMCQRLNMEDSAHEIMQQLGMLEKSRISFGDFIRCRSQVLSEVEPAHYVDDTGIESDTSAIVKQPKMTSWPTMSSDSLGVHSGKPESLDYDSGARDLSPEPVSLQKLMEMHDPNAYRKLCDNYSGANSFLELANRLHLAALTSLKGEIIELTNRLQYVSSERDQLEKQLNKSQTDRLRLQREYDDKLEQITARYEERITELHSVIAELRKKIERHNINVIREEDEYEESDPGQSAKSNDEVISINENNANESQSASIDMGNDLNSDLSQVVSDLEIAISNRKCISADLSGEPYAEEAGADNDSIEENAIQVCKDVATFHLMSPTRSHRNTKPQFHPPPPPPPNELPDPAYLQEEVNSIRAENSALQEQLGRQESDLNRLKAHLSALREDREKLRRKVRELQCRLQVFESPSSHDSRTSTPTKSPQLNLTTGERSASDQFPVAKIAELKKLKTSSSDRQVLGAEISSLGLPNAKVAEHLVQSLQECSNMQEIVQTLYKCGNEISENKIREFEIEFERLTSKIDHLKSQNDLVTLNLEESKAHTDRLSVLIGKYESNNTALQLAINYSDQAIEAYEVLCAILESEQGIMLANCKAVGLGGFAGEPATSEEQDEVARLLQRAHHARKTAENVAKHLLQKLDRSCGVHILSCSPRPWEDLSSNSRTTSTTSSTGSSADADFSKMDEQRLREYIQQLKNDRGAVKMTVLELESVHIDPMSEEPQHNADAQRLDLENAVLMQELMAMKEEKAELKAQNYLLEKEKRALELRLNGKESQEQAYIVQIDHLKSEVKEQQQKLFKDGRSRKEEDGDATSPTLLAEIHARDTSEITHDLIEAMKRERKLKNRVQELVLTLEKISRNSEIRHQQSAEFVNDLKRANSALISAFDKAKKKYQSRVKKMESQMQEMSKQYEAQIRLLEQRLAVLEKEKVRPPTNETSL